MRAKRYLPLLWILGACRYGELQSPDKLFRESELLWRRGLNRQALKLVDNGWQRWKSRPDSEWHWKFRLFEAELLENEGLNARARELLATGPGALASSEIQARYLSL